LLSSDLGKFNKDHGYKNNWSLFEVFVRSKQGLSHRHVGSLRAPDDEIALQNACDVYTRRNEGISIWVVKSELITSSQPDEK
jgi:ring-1,2-phenylacetyl-CoA epoxidase subunit PaaB